MSVDPEISRRIVQEELEAMLPLASSYRWQVASDLDQLTVTVEMTSSVDEQTYILEAKCDGYKALPPYFEFIHSETGERGTPRCYPLGTSFFHSLPCICVQWNRKAYQEAGGPHGDWQTTNWMSYRPGMTALGDMFNLVQMEINKKDQYRGRMA
jgi:hypothetical protein